MIHPAPAEIANQQDTLCPVGCAEERNMPKGSKEMPFSFHISEGANSIDLIYQHHPEPLSEITNHRQTLFADNCAKKRFFIKCV